jgi:phage-related holin
MEVEQMSGSFLLGFLLGFSGVLTVAVIFLLIKYKTGTLKEKYDERQTAKRGVAFKIGFFTMLIAGAIIAAIDTLLYNKGLNQMTAMLITLCIGAAAFACYSVWSDAYVGINHKNKKSTYLLITALFLCNGMISVIHYMENGLLSFTEQGINISANFIVTILLGVVLFNALLKEISEGKERDDYEKPEA